ncbi:MAG: hypothetical protein ACKVU0_01525 [Saprospiraceae bacterium]
MLKEAYASLVFNLLAPYLPGILHSAQPGKKGSFIRLFLWQLFFSGRLALGVYPYEYVRVMQGKGNKYLFHAVK